MTNFEKNALQELLWMLEREIVEGEFEFYRPFTEDEVRKYITETQELRMLITMLK